MSLKEPIETFFQNDDDVTIDYALIGHSIRDGVTKSCLVNTRGKVDSHIPADILMEHNVRTIKGTSAALGLDKINKEVIRKELQLKLKQHSKKFQATSANKLEQLNKLSSIKPRCFTRCKSNVL